MNDFETTVKDIDSKVGVYISKLQTKEAVFVCVWFFFLIYLWARAMGVGLLIMDFSVFLFIVWNAYLAVKSGQELWKRVARGSK